MVGEIEWTRPMALEVAEFALTKLLELDSTVEQLYERASCRYELEKWEDGINDLKDAYIKNITSDEGCEYETDSVDIELHMKAVSEYKEKIPVLLGKFARKVAPKKGQEDSLKEYIDRLKREAMIISEAESSPPNSEGNNVDNQSQSHKQNVSVPSSPNSQENVSHNQSILKQYHSLIYSSKRSSGIASVITTNNESVSVKSEQLDGKQLEDRLNLRNGRTRGTEFPTKMSHKDSQQPSVTHRHERNGGLITLKSIQKPKNKVNDTNPFGPRMSTQQHQVTLKTKMSEFRDEVQKSIHRKQGHGSQSRASKTKTGIPESANNISLNSSRSNQQNKVPPAKLLRLGNDPNAQSQNEKSQGKAENVNKFVCEKSHSFGSFNLLRKMDSFKEYITLNPDCNDDDLSSFSATESNIVFRYENLFYKDRKQKLLALSNDKKALVLSDECIAKLNECHGTQTTSKHVLKKNNRVKQIIVKVDDELYKKISDEKKIN